MPNWYQQPGSTNCISGYGVDYDNDHDLTVFFGGDTTGRSIFEWDGTTMTEFTPTGTWPLGRRSMGWCYDRAHHEFVMFGGSQISPSAYKNDTWTYNPVTRLWTQKSPTTVPPVRAFHLMAYDRVRGEVVMYGGENQNNRFNVPDAIFDTYTWDGSNWHLKSPAHVPIPTCQATNPVAQGAWNDTTGVVVLAGAEVNPPYAQKTCTWDGTDWTITSITDTPYDVPVIASVDGWGVVVLWDYGPSVSVHIPGTWQLNNTPYAWTDLATATMPPLNNFASNFAQSPGVDNVVVYVYNHQIWTWKGPAAGGFYATYV
jgi:hypothetical protein